MARRNRYSSVDKRLFLVKLAAYRDALISGNKRAIIVTSIQVHAAKAGVPKSWYPMVGRVFREATRKTEGTHENPAAP